MTITRSIRRGVKPVRDLDLIVPKSIQEKDLQALFEAYALTPSQQTQMAAFLKELISAFQKEIASRQRRRTRADDRKNLQNAAERLYEAHRYLEACGPIGRTIIRNNISHLGEMLSAGWIRQKFPKFELPKEEYGTVNLRSRLTPRGEQVDVEEHTVRHRRLFASSQNITLVSGVLDEIRQSLKEALSRSKGHGGRNRAELRLYFIMNLARFWNQIGKDPWATGEFQFHQFSGDVLDYMGWPRSGLRAVIRKALADFPARS